MKTFDLKYGKTKVQLTLSEERVVEVVEGSAYPPIEDQATAFVEALNNPVGTPALKDIVKAGETVCIVVSDVTRAFIGYPNFLPLLLNYLNEQGIPDKDIFLLIALGNHRFMTDVEISATYGEETARRVRVEQSCGKDPACKFRQIGMSSVGVPIEINEFALDADRVILTGATIYHLLAGFGGGRKAIIPGIASTRSIQGNHSLCLRDEGGILEEIKSGNTETNPVNVNMLEFGEALNADFLINTVHTAEGKVARYATGHWQLAWEDAQNTVREIMGVPIKALADCVVATAGGFPKDINLYQSVKTQDNAWQAAKEGGVLILLLELSDIREPEEFFDWFRYPTLEEHEAALRLDFTIPGFVALAMRTVLQRFPHIIVTEEMNRAILEEVGFNYAATVEEAMTKAEAIIGRPDFTVTVMPQGANTLPLLK